MTGAIPIAFYAPLKSPHHLAPSGDRTMARLLMRALEEAGFAPRLASELRSFEPAGDAAAQARLKRDAEAEADRLSAAYRAAAATTRPRLWFTYHLYYKAPDWIGPRVADALGIPYVVAEASHAAKRAGGPWALAHEAAEAALGRADAVFVMTEADREALELIEPVRRRLIDLPPFVDLGPWRDDARDAEARTDGAEGATPPGGLRLLTVAMMRDGDKLASYRLLGEALERIEGRAWRLDVVGAGDRRSEVERRLARFGARVTFHGEVREPKRLRALYRAADLFVWPAVNEAYGMALLEAQAFGCPVVAGAFGGVASVVRDGETGILAPPGDAAALASAVAALAEAPARRRALGRAAESFVRRERSLDQAAGRLRTALAPLVAETAAP